MPNWASPRPVFEALENLFPTLTFEVEWTDEGSSENHSRTYHKGI